MLGHAGYPASTGQHEHDELDHSDQGSYRSGMYLPLNGLDHEVGIDDLSVRGVKTFFSH